MAEVVTGKLSEVRDAEVIIERPDGSRITVVVNIRPHKNQRGEVIGAINCFDITQRKVNEEALRLSDSNKTEFLAMLAHELRNPLAPILVSIEILRRAQQLDEILGSALTGPTRQPSRQARTYHRVDHALKVLTRQVAHMVRLVDDLLDAARISRGKIELRRERVDVSSVVLNAVDAARPLCEHLQHELTVTVPSDPVFLNADPARLAQIVGNLLNNVQVHARRAHSGHGGPRRVLPSRAFGKRRRLESAQRSRSVCATLASGSLPTKWGASSTCSRRLTPHWSGQSPGSG